MGQTLILEMPNEIYEPLANRAKQTGITPEKLAAEWLELAVRYAVNDPVENLIGAISSDAPDWVNQHDEYLGKALMEQMHSIKSKGD